MLSLSDYIKEIENITSVSRETVEQLLHFSDLIKKWNSKINLVAHKDLDHLWQRHIIDSAQLVNYLPKQSSILTDFGSGGGFPGVVLAILHPWQQVHLVESDTRKCAFLRQVSAELSLNITIHNQRIESLKVWQSDVITARALRSITILLEWLYSFVDKSQICLFLKGENSVQEIEDASHHWYLEYDLHPSITCETANILAITKAYRRETHDHSK